MNRLVYHEQGEEIAEAMSVIPVRIMDRLRHVDFLAGVDPVFAGLHAFTDTADGRSYRGTAHTAYRFHTFDRSVTIALPHLVRASIVVHELGHALDDWLGFGHVAQPVSAYAQTNRQEAFAESFVAWLYWYGDQRVFHGDFATRALFESLR